MNGGRIIEHGSSDGMIGEDGEVLRRDGTSYDVVGEEVTKERGIRRHIGRCGGECGIVGGEYGVVCAGLGDESEDVVSSSRVDGTLRNLGELTRKKRLAPRKETNRGK
jgi:hypothetical protein